MPREAMDALLDHIESRRRSFVPLERNCTTVEDQARLAKYIGKYAYKIVAMAAGTSSVRRASKPAEPGLRQGFKIRR